MNIKKFFTLKRSLIYFIALILTALLLIYAKVELTKADSLIQSAENKIADAVTLDKLLDQYLNTVKLFTEAKNLYSDMDIATEESQLKDLKILLLDRNIKGSEELYYSIINSFNTKLAIEEEKAEVSGIVSNSNTPLSAITIQIISGDQMVKETQTDDSGFYSFRLVAGNYIIKAISSTHNDFTQEINLLPKTKETINISLVKKQKTVTASTTYAPVSSTQNDGLYSKQTISTSNGNFTVHLMHFNLSQYEMIVDSASDDDCQNECPVKSLSEYIAINNAIAGIHGTYFCPTAYESCAGKTNSFYYKIYNGRIKKEINWNNGLGDYLPFIAVNNSSVKYFDSWIEAKNNQMSTGISCRPHLVENGVAVVTLNDMDSDKESSYKMSHGFIGHKENEIYVGIVLSANLFDSAQVSLALGLDNSFNLDGGGTSAMFYNGSYKVGPGRNMPNAIIFRLK